MNKEEFVKAMLDNQRKRKIAEGRRNQPKLIKTLNDIDFITVKWGKRILNIAIGE